MKFYFTFFIILLGFHAKAQSIYNAELIQKIDELTFTEKINVLVLVKSHTELDNSILAHDQIHYNVGPIYSVTADKQAITRLALQTNVLRIEYVQHHLQLMSDTAHVRNRIKDVKLGTGPLLQSYDGTGVIVGIIDSGTDFNHPDFKDANGNSRIKYLWDMTKSLAVNTPTVFNYGQEWTNSQIDLGQCTHNDVASHGHGTNSSGIAAGNGYSFNKYEGVAPKADIIVVALDFSRSGFTISDAVQYIISKAQLINKPVVINASVGDYYGSHDGTDLETQIINNMIANIPGRALVASCGNGGSLPFHLGYNIVSADTSFSWIKNNATLTDISEFADTAQVKQVQYSIGVTNPAFKDLGATLFKPYNYALNTVKRDTIYHNLQRIGIISSVASINTFGVYELAITIKVDSLGYLWSISHTGTGRIDSWNFDYMTSGIPQSSQYPKIIHYKMADTLQTIVSGFQCSNEVIAVGNYINRSQYIDVNNNLQIVNQTPGALHATSSLGPTRDNRLKPDITASGATILTSLPLSMLPLYAVSFPTVVAQGGYHRTAGGTSASSPLVAGLAALYFQKHPTATNQQLKQAIINCAYQDSFTGISLPNNKWGYGKLDGFATMTCGEIVNAVNALDISESQIQVFPNPFANEAKLLFPSARQRNIKVYNVSGQLVMEDRCQFLFYTLKKNMLAAGLYYVLADDGNVICKTKIVIL